MACADTRSTQIYDISIDKVNKPFLPVASGEMSVQFAWVAVRQILPPWGGGRVSGQPAPSLQVLALAVGGASIVMYNFGQLITVRCCSRRASLDVSLQACPL